jgi:hypothetical protein
MPKDAFSGKLTPNNVSTSTSLLSPDNAWLRFVETMSSPSQPPALGSAGTEKFRASAFITIYADHREKFDKAPALINKRG